MADEGSFQTGICSSNWWCTSRSPFTVGSSSPCSTSLTTEMGSYAWSSSSTPADALNMPRASYDGRGSSESDSAVDGSVLMDSQLAQSMTRLIGLSSPTIEWSHALRSSGERGESNFQAMLQGEDQDPTDHSQKNWNQSCGFSTVEDNTLNMAFKPAMSQAFAFDQQRTISSNSGDCTVTTQSIPSNSYIPMTSTSYGYPSTLLQGLYEPNSLTTHQTSFDNQAPPMSYSSSPNYSRINSNDFQQSWPKVPPFLKTPPRKQQPSNQLHLSNTSSSFWNPSATTAAAMTNDKTSLYSPPQSQFLAPVFEEKPSSSNLAATSKLQRNAEEIRDSSSSMTKKASSSTSEGSFKKPRVETPSPLPTFKVRKEKLGDRITALQQLVSPFGKTDTASVLFEAIEYIKFLHEQVSVLSTPYMKNSTGAPMQQQQISVEVSTKEGGGEGGKQDLRSRGLCLMPISSTFSVTNETTADFWTPTFGGTFR